MRSSPHNPLALGSAVQYLLVINLAVFAVQFWLEIQNPGSRAVPLAPGSYIWMSYTFGLVPGCVFNFSANGCTFPFEIWQPLTYMFLHGGLWHIAFNMLALWMFGNVLERVWGMRRFFQYYFFCGIGAGLLVTLIAVISGEGLFVPTIGASGAVLGLLAAFGMMFPENIIYLYFFPVKARYAVWIFGGLSLMFALSNTLPGISHFGHLGGIVFGLIFLYGRSWLRRLNI